jgi:hypothetical protein
MTRRMSAEERYSRDPLFHHLVDSLCHAIESLDLTPTEIREAAMLAQLKYEQNRVSPGVVLTREERERLDMRIEAINAH